MADQKKEEYSRAAGAGPQSQAEAPHQSFGKKHWATGKNSAKFNKVKF